MPPDIASTMHAPSADGPRAQSPVPSASAMRRVLRRARDGVRVDVTEAATLLHVRGQDLVDLCAGAARVRDSGLAAAGRPGTLTYSPKVFVPLTTLCRDRCHYCTFVQAPAQLARQGKDLFLSPDQVLEIARQGAAAGCAEALFTLGDRPEDRWPQARQWLDSRGYASTLEYVRAMAILVLEETGLLPHLNPGVMTWAELSRLKPVAPSMGLMLETSSRRLFEEPGQVHHGSPDKDPAVRLRCLDDAGRLSIPFTTGVLVGIGETPTELAESIFAIRAAHQRFGHVQEVIVQNFRAKPDTAMRAAPDADDEAYLAAIAVTRLVLGPGMRVQAPPNLSDLARLPALVGAGVDDWGGVSPVTADHVNPERPWPSLTSLEAECDEAGFRLVPRLTAHPEFVRRGEPWIDPRVRPHVDALAGPDGLAARPVRPVGRPWQEPDHDWEGGGRTDLHQAIDSTGRNTAWRSDLAEVYGSWDEVRADHEASRGTAATPRVTGTDADLAAALRRAEADPRALTDAHLLTLLTADGDGLDAVAALADELRRQAVGETVSYVVTRNLNFTNVCYTGCRFCAFAQRRNDADAFTLSLDEVATRAAQAWAAGATEVCMQGGIDPELPGTGYFDLARAVKRGAPGLHLHAFSPMEVMNGVARTGLSVREFLTELKAAGVDSIPGTAAEILDDEVRWLLTKGKLPTSAWLDVVGTAHSVGLPSTATMMYGHVDEPRHWVTHLRTLVQQQESSGGFTEFVPLPFVHTSAPIYLAGVARPGPTARENRAVHAVARIALHGLVDNIQVSWVKLGEAGAQAMLRGGCNDLGGTLMEETISRMAGSQNGSSRTPAELESIATGIGRPVRQRTTLYGTVPAERQETSRRVRTYLDVMARASR